jgi:hypothetical protein
VQRSAESIRVMRPLFQAGEGGSIPTSALELFVEPMDFEQARSLNRMWHSRLPRFGIGCVKSMPFDCYAATFAGVIYAVAIWSNPVARELPQQAWLELRRQAVAPDAPRNTPSRMLAVMARLIRRQQLNIERLISYQDTESHTGGIYRAAGWTAVDVSKTKNEWDCPARSRPKSQSDAPKIRWEKRL